MCVYHIISNIQNVLNVKILFMYVYYRICIPTTKGIPLAPKKKKEGIALAHVDLNICLGNRV